MIIFNIILPLIGYTRATVTAKTETIISDISPSIPRFLAFRQVYGTNPVFPYGDILAAIGKNVKLSISFSGYVST